MFFLRLQLRKYQKYFDAVFLCVYLHYLATLSPSFINTPLVISKLQQDICTRVIFFEKILTSFAFCIRLTVRR